jgi:RNA polymerase sigma factor (sigma-70 family)
MCADLDEAGLVRDAVAGDADAVMQLLDQHRQIVWAVCYRITGNHHDAEDALQDAVVAAWRNLHKFRGQSRFGTWYYRVAANAALMVLRRRRDVLVESDHIIERQGQFSDYGQIDEADRVQRAVARLPEAYRVALVLRVWGDLSYADIAEHLGVPVDTVKSRLHRARQHVAQFLTEAEALPPVV